MAIGEQIRRAGYWGYFGLDFLLDQDTGALYLGELNPRITGATPLTSQAALDQDEVPLLLFHLLEWLGVEYAVDVAQFNQRWVKAEQTTSWSQMILEHTAETVDMVTQGPANRHLAHGGRRHGAIRTASVLPAGPYQRSRGVFIRTSMPVTAAEGECIGRLHNARPPDDGRLSINRAG